MGHFLTRCYKNDWLTMYPAHRSTTVRRTGEAAGAQGCKESCYIHCRAFKAANARNLWLIIFEVGYDVGYSLC